VPAVAVKLMELNRKNPWLSLAATTFKAETVRADVSGQQGVEAAAHGADGHRSIDRRGPGPPDGFPAGVACVRGFAGFLRPAHIARGCAAVVPVRVVRLAKRSLAGGWMIANDVALVAVCLPGAETTTLTVKFVLVDGTVSAVL